MSGDVAAVRRLIEDHVNVNCTQEVFSVYLDVHSRSIKRMYFFCTAWRIHIML